jgi:hypothetical protein
MNAAASFKTDLSATLGAIKERRIQLINEIGRYGRLNRLSIASLLDLLTLIAFDDSCTGTLSSRQLYQISGSPAWDLWDDVTHALGIRKSCDPDLIHSEMNDALQRGADLANGHISIGEAWTKRSLGRLPA